MIMFGNNAGKKLKPKTCRFCKEVFYPWNSTQTVCSPSCAIDLVDTSKYKQLERDRRRAEKINRKKHREAKERIKTRSAWLKDVQNNAFNPFIRARDKNEPCISCGRYDNEIEDVFIGGKWDCGHYLTRGAYPELRFEELNAHKQCKSCNGGSGKYAKKNRTVTQQYTDNLINKIGIVQYEWLKSKHGPKKYTIDELRDMKKHYKEKLKLLNR